MVPCANWSGARVFTLMDESPVGSLINQMGMPVRNKALHLARSWVKAPISSVLTPKEAFMSIHGW